MYRSEWVSQCSIHLQKRDLNSIVYRQRYFRPHFDSAQECIVRSLLKSFRDDKSSAYHMSFLQFYYFTVRKALFDSHRQSGFYIRLVHFRTLSPSKQFGTVSFSIFLYLLFVHFWKFTLARSCATWCLEVLC